jgi:flagellar hook-associated protein 3 FlgL
MPVVPNVSFLGSSHAQIGRLKSLNVSLTDLQRQLTTQKRYDNYSGLGFDSLTVQRYHMDKSRMQTYLGNIDSGLTRVQLMSQSLTRGGEIGRELLSTLQTHPGSSIEDTATMARLAGENLQFMNDIMNVDVDGRYLFAGSSSDSIPMTNIDSATPSIQAAITNWLNGSQTTTQFLTTLDGLSDSNLGFNSDLSSSGSVSLRINKTTNLDYTSIATENGLRDLFFALNVIKNIQQPNPAVDTATVADFNTVISAMADIVQEGISKIDTSNAGLSGKFDLLTTTQGHHQEDVGLFETLLAKKENVDINEVAVNIQTLQTQLSAAYQVTSMVSELTLVNFLR